MRLWLFKTAVICQERAFETHIGFSGLVPAVIRAAAPGARQQQALHSEYNRCWNRTVVLLFSEQSPLYLSVVSVHPVLKNSLQSVPWGSWGGALVSRYCRGDQPPAEDGRSWQKAAESYVTCQKSSCCYRSGCWSAQREAGGKQLWTDWRQSSTEFKRQPWMVFCLWADSGILIKWTSLCEIFWKTSWYKS